LILATSILDAFEVRLGSDSIVLNEDYCRIIAEEVQLNGLKQAVLGPELNANLQQLNANLRSLLTALNTYASAQAAASAGTLAPLAPGYTALVAAVTSLDATVAAWDSSLIGHLTEKVKLG
jgi:hypothetical protein